MLISYVFPPAGGITVQRALSFAKYLPSHDIEVHVLTARNASAPVWDPGLLKHVPPEVHVHRCFTLEPPFSVSKKLWSLVGSRQPSQQKTQDVPPSEPNEGFSLKKTIKSLLTPDTAVLWVPLALRRAASLIRRHQIDTVLVTAPPFSVFLIGNALKQRFPEIRLISDFRDEWLRFYLTDLEFVNNEATRLKAQQIERDTVTQSDLVLAVTRSSAAEIRSRYPELPDSKFVHLANGYDPEVFSNFRPRSNQSSCMVVTHMGTAYRTASPRFYLDALDSLPEEVRSTIETRFVGRIAESETEMFANRKSPIKLVGFLPQTEALRLTEETDYLLLTMTNDFSLPGKLFEYLATGKPVLALSPPGGEVDQLLKETHSGFCVDHTDPEAIRAMLLTAWKRWRAGETAEGPDWEAIHRYQRPQLAEQLAGILAQ